MVCLCIYTLPSLYQNEAPPRYFPIPRREQTYRYDPSFNRDFTLFDSSFNRDFTAKKLT